MKRENQSDFSPEGIAREGLMHLLQVALHVEQEWAVKIICPTSYRWCFVYCPPFGKDLCKLTYRTREQAKNAANRYKKYWGQTRRRRLRLVVCKVQTTVEEV